MATTAGVDVEEVLCVVSLVSHLMQFRERWRFLQPQAFTAVMVRVAEWMGCASGVRGGLRGWRTSGEVVGRVRGG